MTTTIEKIAAAIESGRKHFGQVYGDEFTSQADYCKPWILCAEYTYGSTAGPFGGIGGQMISSFEHVTVIWECHYVYVHVGKDKGFGGIITREFHERLMRGENPWHLARFLKKKEAKDA